MICNMYNNPIIFQTLHIFLPSLTEYRQFQYDHDVQDCFKHNIGVKKTSYIDHALKTKYECILIKIIFS